jgi:alpha-glucosidase
VNGPGRAAGTAKGSLGTVTNPAPRAVPTAASEDGWWRSAVTYQLYIRSFADSDGDGLGDVEGIRSRLPYLASLGVDALWINPWYPSPQADGGYDVADYRDIHPAFGTLESAQKLIDAAHDAGLKVLLDIVPNHTSDEHPWFADAVAAGPGSPERARYIFRPGRGPGGAEPPNDWRSVFGGTAWERVTEPDGRPGEWYLHLFDVKQPDLDWSNESVKAEFRDVLRFWFDRGADGFRIDVAHGLTKDPMLPDVGHEEEKILGHVDRDDHPYWDRPEVHEIYADWRRIADSYDPPRVFVAEAWVASSQKLAAYLRPEHLHTAFDFDFVRAPWRAADLRATATSSLAAHDTVDAPVMWVLSNHDITRHVTRYGKPQDERGADPLHPLDAAPTDVAIGTRRARAATLLVLALPGGVYLYQGEELGLPEVEDLPEDLLQDPTWERSGHTVRGRDGCRVPLPWAKNGESLGFGPNPGWLPQPPEWAHLSVEAQEEDPGSMLALYREALRLRRELPQLGAGGGPLTWADDALEESGADHGDVLAFTRPGGFTCVVNTGREPVRLPAGRVVLSSVPVDDGALPADAAAWLVAD